MRAVDWFNEHLKERRNPLLLDDRNIDLYSLYMAKKTGKPNDDFPSKFLNNEVFVDIEKTQIVSKINYNRFALVVEKGAIVMNPIFAQQSLITQRDPKKASMMPGDMNGMNGNIYDDNG